MNNNIKFVYLKSETVYESFIKDVITFTTLCLSAYITHKLDNDWWTFIVSLIFLFFIISKIKKEINDNFKIFNNMRDAKEWVKSLPDD